MRPMIIINKNRPIRFKIKGLIIIILSEPRNDYNHTSARSAGAAAVTELIESLNLRKAPEFQFHIWPANVRQIFTRRSSHGAYHDL